MASVLDEKNRQQIVEHVQLGNSVVDSVIEIGKMAMPEDEACELNSTLEPGTVASDFRECKKTGNSVGHVATQNANVNESLSVGESWETKPALDISNPTSEESKNDALIDKLASGILTAVLPEHANVKKQLGDITHSQSVLIETIEHENAKFQEIQVIREVAAIMDKARLYQLKLVNIKKEMMSLHEKTNQLKRRALKLQQQKQKEALTKEQRRDEELEKEKKLMAKVVLRKT